MKKAAILFIILFSILPARAQKANQDKNQTSSNNKQETKINPGASGVKRSIAYRFSSLVQPEKPGEGIFRFNSGTIDKVTYLIVDDKDMSGEDQTKWYSTWDDTTGAMARGQITLVESDGKNVAKFDVSGLFSHANGFWKIPVRYVSGAMPANGSIYYYVFERIDHKKDQAGQVKTPEEVKPVEQPAPVAEVKPSEEPKPVVEVKPVEQAAPISEATPAEEQKPVTEPKPAEQPSQPVVEAKPAENPRQPKEASQPGTVTRQSESQAVSRKQSAQTTPVAQNTQNANQPAQKSGTTFTSRVTQGAQPETNAAAPQSYQSNLPSYQYRYSSEKRAHGKCYAGIIEIGYALGLGDYGVDNFRFNFINGFHIGPTFTAGLGIGVRRYYFDHENYTEVSPVSGKIQIPVFVDLRKTFSTSAVTPYLAFGIGNSVRFNPESHSTENVKEGLLVNASGGIWFNLSSRFAVFCGAAYESQKMEYILLSDDSHFRKNGNSVSLNIGIAF